MSLDSNGILVPTGNSSTSFYNANRDQPVDAHVPELIETTQGVVTTALALNQAFAQDAVNRANTAIDALGALVLPPELPDPPPAPAITTSFAAAVQLGFDAQPNWGELPQSFVDDFVVAPITVPDIAALIPDYTPLVTGLAIPDAPTLTLPAVPDAPTIETDFALPDAPAADYGSTPSLEDILLPAYTPPVLPVFGDAAPEFDVLPPDPFIAWTEPVYASSMKDAVATVLDALLAGGTGIPADVQAADWERSRQREDVAGQKAIDEAAEAFAARGFAVPPGALNLIALAVREEVDRKATELSRDIAIKDADLEQKNRQFAVEKALDYERIFVAVFLAVVERNFQIAKFGAETQIQVYNLQITGFNVEQQVWAQKIVLYRAQLDGVFAYLKAFESLVEFEKAKASINLSRVQLFESRVRAFSSQVDAYGKLVDSVRTRAELQRGKIDLYRGEIEATVALIGAERAKFEAYDARVRGESAKVGLEEANARVYSTRVQGIGERANLLLKQADVSLQSNRQKLDWNIANMQRLTANNGAQLNLVQARLAAFQATTGRGLAKYQADKEGKTAELQATISLSQVAISKYLALLEQWKTRSTEVIQITSLGAESVRAAATASATLAAGAMAGTHVSAGISAGSSASQSNNRSSSDSTSQNKNVSENSNYSVVHNYQHRT